MSTVTAEWLSPMAVGHRAAGDPEVDGGDGRCKARWQLDIGKRDGSILADAAGDPEVDGGDGSYQARWQLDIGNAMAAFPPMLLAVPCSLAGSRSVSLHDPAGSTSASTREVLH